MSVMFDVNLEALVDETHTLSNFLSPKIDEANSLRKTIQKTAWPNIDICPASLGLRVGTDSNHRGGPTAIAGAFRMLRIGLEEVRRRRWVSSILPVHGHGREHVDGRGRLADPVPARQPPGYLSTIHFMQTCREAMDLVSKFDTSIDYGFIRVVYAMFQPNRTNEAQMLQVMEDLRWPDSVDADITCRKRSKRMPGYPMSSIYEINKPYGSHQTYTRCRDNLNMVFREIEKDICKQWPSRMAQVGTDELTGGMSSAGPASQPLANAIKHRRPLPPVRQGRGCQELVDPR